MHSRLHTLVAAGACLGTRLEAAGLGDRMLRRVMAERGSIEEASSCLVVVVRRRGALTHDADNPAADGVIHQSASRTAADIWSHNELNFEILGFYSGGAHMKQH